MDWGRRNRPFHVLESASIANDLGLISNLRSIQDVRMLSGIRFPAYCLFLVAVLGSLSRCQSMLNLEHFAIRHHAVLTESLSIKLRRSP